MPSVKPMKDTSLPFLLTVAALISLVFSYQPLLQLGTVSGVNIDVSLCYLIVAAALLANLPLLLRSIHIFAASPVWNILFCLVIYIGISSIWSENPVRASITSVFWLVVIGLVSIVMLHTKQLFIYKTSLTRLFTIAYKLVLLWAIWQLLADAFSIPSLYTLLPAMYSGSVFGFARPTGFALEPQFFGSLLLIPLGWLTARSFTKKQISRYEFISFAALLSLLIILLSRGALIGYFVTVISLLATLRPSRAYILRFISLGTVSTVVAFTLIFTLGSLRANDNISGMQAVSRSLQHLSLGIVASNHPGAIVPTAAPAPADGTVYAAAPSDGYIASSTTSRLSASQEAIELWSADVQTMLFGVGIGAFGVNTDSKDPSAIVNNYYIELLVETGLVGTTLFIVFMGTLFVKLLRHKHWLIFSILLGILVQANFFSGNANILHLWALVGVALALVTHKKHRAFV